MARRYRRVVHLVLYDGIYGEFATFESLYQGYLDARKGKRYQTNVMRVSSRVEVIISDILRELATGEWRPSKYYSFECRTEVKRRIIHAPVFRDRIVHHALCRVIRPLFERKYIFDLYSSVKGKGQHRAVRRLQHFMRQVGKGAYVLQCDIRKYYDSIDHEILKKQMRETIRDPDVLRILDLLIDSYNGDTGKGIPIGSLMSQLFANVYLTRFDHWLKDDCGERFYLRFMDDFILISQDKEHLKAAWKDISWALSQLGLTLNSKTQLYPAARGVDFAGYRTFRNRVLPRKRNVKAAKKRFRKLAHAYRCTNLTLDDVKPAVTSFVGYMSHCQGARSARSALRYMVLTKGDTENVELLQRPRPDDDGDGN